MKHCPERQGTTRRSSCSTPRRSPISMQSVPGDLFQLGLTLCSGLSALEVNQRHKKCKRYCKLFVHPRAVFPIRSLGLDVFASAEGYPDGDLLRHAYTGSMNITYVASTNGSFVHSPVAIASSSNPLMNSPISPSRSGSISSISFPYILPNVSTSGGMTSPTVIGSHIAFSMHPAFISASLHATIWLNQAKGSRVTESVSREFESNLNPDAPNLRCVVQKHAGVITGDRADPVFVFEYGQHRFLHPAYVIPDIHRGLVPPQIHEGVPDDLTGTMICYLPPSLSQDEIRPEAGQTSAFGCDLFFGLPTSRGVYGSVL